MTVIWPVPWLPGADEQGSLADATQQNFDAVGVTVGPVAQSIPTLVSALPTSPFNNQVIYYLADDTNGIVWQLRYRAASGSAYKWEFVGGAPLEAEVATNQSITSNAYGDMATVGPSVTVPLGGDYIVSYGARLSTNNAAQDAYATVSPPATDAVAVSHNMVSVAGVYVHGSRVLRLSFSAGQLVKQMYRGNGGSTTTADRRWLIVTPVRVG